MFAVIIGVIGVRRQRDSLLRAADHALVWVCALTALATIGLTRALVDGDLALRYVAEHVARNLPAAYRAGALWSGTAGRSLAFAFLLSAMLCFALRPGDRSARWATPAGALALALAIAAAMLQAPFARLSWQPTEGNGMQPALQSPDALAVAPFALVALGCCAVAAVLALAAGRRDRAVPWLLAAWLAMTLTLTLGMRTVERVDQQVWHPLTSYAFCAGWILTAALLFPRRMRHHWQPVDGRRRHLLAGLAATGAVLIATSVIGRELPAAHTIALGQGQSLRISDRLGREWQLAQQGVSMFRAGHREVLAVTLEATPPGRPAALLVAERSQFVDSRGEELWQPVTYAARLSGPIQSLSARISDVAPNDVAHLRVVFTPFAAWLWPGVAALLLAGLAAFLRALRSA